MKKPLSMWWHQIWSSHDTRSARVDGPRYILVCQCRRFWEVW